jgi:hypothetical protein
VRKDLKDIDQSLRNDVLEVQEEYAALYGMDPYYAGIFFWGCIYEQIEAALGNPYFADCIMGDLILNVMGDDKIYEDMRTDLARHRAREMKEEFTVDEQLADFGRMARRIVVSGRIDRINAMRRMLLLHDKATKGIQKILEKMMSKPDYHGVLLDFIPEYRENPENRDEIVRIVIKVVNRSLGAYRKKLRKAAEIARTAMDIEIERGRNYGFE